MDTVVECQALVDRLCSEWGLRRIKVRASKGLLEVAGRAHYRQRAIMLAGWLLEAAPEEVEDTVRHEFAHHLVYNQGRSDGHGRNWQEAAVACGARPEKYYSDDLDAKRIQYHTGPRGG